MKKIKAIKMATGGLMSQPPYIAKQDSKDESLIQAYDVNTPASARQGLPSRAMSSSRTRMNKGGQVFDNAGGVTTQDMNIGKEFAPESKSARGVIKKSMGGLLNKRLKFGAGDISTKELLEMKKMEQLEAMQDSGLPLTDEQIQSLEAYKATKAIKAQELAIGGVVTEKYSTQRPDYQAYAEGGEVEEEMILEDISDENMPVMEELETEEESLLQPMGMEDEMPMDDEMEDEEDYGDMDAIIDTSALSDEEEKVLDDAVEMHPELEAIIPKLVATEFTEDGEVEGPGTGTSDSIPALLSDGEFVFTAKAVKSLGVDKLRSMMKQAEESYDAGISSQVEEV